MRNIPWQARDVLAVFEKLDQRPGGILSVQVLWHNVLRGEAVATGVKWLVDAGYVSLNPVETAVTLTEAGYKVIMGEEPEAGREEPAPPPPQLLSAKSPMRRAIILTALEVETRALLRHIPEWTDELVDRTVFCRGEFEGWDLAIAEVGVGNNEAAVIAERGIRHFEPEVALFVGVAGGIKDVRLGDVVVASKVYGYERGKEDGDGFKPRADSHPARALEQRARVTRLRPEWKKRLDPKFANDGAHIEVAPIAACEAAGKHARPYRRVPASELQRRSGGGNGRTWILRRRARECTGTGLRHPRNF